MPSQLDRLPSEDFIFQVKDLNIDELTQKADQLQLSPESPLNQKWYVHYRLAQKISKEHPDQSCRYWVRLAQDPLFPLKDISFLKAHEFCSPFNLKLARINNLIPDETKPWLKGEALNIALESALNREDRFEILELSYEKSKLSLPKEEKIALTEQALEQALLFKSKVWIDKLEKRLQQLSPSRLNQPGPGSFLEIANDYRRKREFTEALSFYNRIVKSNSASFSIKTRALKNIRKTHKLMHDKPAYIKATETYAAFIEKSFRWYKKPAHSMVQAFHDSQMMLVRTYWTEDQKSNAKKVLKKLSKTLKGQFSLAKTYWIQGRMAEEEKDFYAALWWFNMGLKEKHISPGLKERLLWLKSWNLRKTKQLEEAVASLTELIGVSSSEFSTARYKFWLGKTYQELEKLELAQITFDELSQEDPLGYYGLHAQRELGLPLKSPSTRTLASIESLKNPNPFLYKGYLDWLMAVDEYDISKKYLNHVAKNMRHSENVTEDHWLELFFYMAQSGHYVELFEQVGHLPSEKRRELITQYPELLFPQPFKNEVQSAASKFNVQPELIYAIIRQESAFNMKARSFADAFGLMQLLPIVGQAQARQNGIKYTEPEDLYKPEINIPLGTSFIQHLLKRHDNQFILAVASYNASEQAILSWVKSRYQGNSMEFIEDIPYEETQSYVRLVMRNMVFYKLLSSPNQTVAFPEWPLDLKIAKNN